MYNQTFIKKHGTIGFYKSTEDDYYTEPQETLPYFNGTMFNLSIDKSHFDYRLKNIHNNITYQMSNYSITIGKMRLLTSFLKEFFPANYLDQIIKRISDRVYARHLTTEEERVTLILSYLQLYYASRELVISPKVLEEISSIMGISLSTEKIHKQFFFIHKIDRLFYKKYSKYLHKLKCIRFLSIFDDYFYRKDIQSSLAEFDVKKIYIESKNTCINYTQSEDFKHQKYNGYETTILALIAHGYRVATGNRSLPFDFLTPKECKYLIEKRSMLKKKLNLGKYKKKC